MKLYMPLIWRFGTFLLRRLRVKLFFLLGFFGPETRLTLTFGSLEARVDHYVTPIRWDAASTVPRRETLTFQRKTKKSTTPRLFGADLENIDN